MGRKRQKRLLEYLVENNIDVTEKMITMVREELGYEPLGNNNNDLYFGCMGAYMLDRKVNFNDVILTQELIEIIEECV